MHNYSNSDKQQDYSSNYPETVSQYETQKKKKNIKPYIRVSCKRKKRN